MTGLRAKKKGGARRRDAGGTHQAGALRLLAEVVEQRGHVAEALGRIFPAIMIIVCVP